MQELGHLEERLARLHGPVGPGELAELLDEDFVEHGASGRVWTRAELLDEMSAWPAGEGHLAEFQVRELADGVALVTYLFVGPERRTRRSSIWRRRGGGWRMTFHQGTSAGA